MQRPFRTISHFFLNSENLVIYAFMVHNLTIINVMSAFMSLILLKLHAIAYCIRSDK